MITISQTNFPAGDILIQGLTDAVGAVNISVGENTFPITDGSFEFSIPSLAAGSYNVVVGVLDADGTKIDEDTFTLVVTDPAPVEPTTPVEPVNTTPVNTPNLGGTDMSTEAQALINLNSSTIQTFVPRYTPMHETDTKNVSIYPGSLTGFGPLSASAHSATKADEFKIVSDEALAANPSAGFTGGRGTGNPDDFGRFPARALMKDVRGEFFPKGGDFDSKTITQYPLGRTADLLENAVNPVGFITKDPETGYAVSSIRGGVNASPIATSGFTF